MSEKPVIAVTGASGLLGRPLMEILSSSSSCAVRGAAFTRSGGSLDRLDLTAPAAAEAWLDEIRPSVLIHLAAERRPDAYAEDPIAADHLNINVTESLARLCSARDVSMLFLSTNYVFDGTAAPYNPEDKPNPLNAYGLGKYAGEQAVTAASSRHRVLRVPMLYGPSSSLAESSVTQIGALFLGSGGPVPLDVRQTRYPAWTPDVAVAVDGLCRRMISGHPPGPVLHFCPGEDQGITKREIGEILAPLLGADASRAVPDTRPPSGAPRPENVRLSCPHMEALGLLKITPFREAISITVAGIRDAGGVSS